MIEFQDTENTKNDNSLSTRDEESREVEYFIEDGWNTNFSNKPQGLSFKPKDTRHYGNCTPLMYYNGEPLILIGPDCNLYLQRDFLSCISNGNIDILPNWQRNILKTIISIANILNLCWITSSLYFCTNCFGS